MAQTAEAGLLDLLARLKAAQRDLLLAAAQGAALPSDGTIRKVSELEGVIAATEALIEEEQRRR